jgi:hypothetical protein
LQYLARPVNLLQDGGPVLVERPPRGDVTLKGAQLTGLTLSLRAAIARCDLCVVDLDQCIYPGFTQITLGAFLLAAAFLPARWRFLPRLLRGAAYIIKIRTRGVIFGEKPSNRDLMAAFLEAIRGWPPELLDRYSLLLPGTGPRRWREALSLLATRMPVYLFTFAIEPIASAYGRSPGRRGRPIFRGWRGSPLPGREEREEVSYSPESFSGETKRGWLEELLSSGGYRRPLIIGHGPDEALMARRARELGGSSIGRKGSESRAEFDILLRGYPWKFISRALTEDS